jgi:hypothetical protein
LAEYFFEDWGKIAAVLGDLETHDRPIKGGFLNRSVLKAPPGLDNGELSVRQNRASGLRHYALVASARESGTYGVRLARTLLDGRMVEGLAITPLENEAGVGG